MSVTPSSASSRGGSRPILLDGGMGHQLRRMGVRIEGEVGSKRRFLGVATANENNPQLVTDAHLAYIDAGCEVITTNNYAVTPYILQQSVEMQGGSMDVVLKEVEKLTRLAGDVARKAVSARPEKSVRVAGSLPPLHESYRPDRVGPFAENLAHYRVIAASLATFADIILCETMSTGDEARAAATAATEVSGSLPVWVAYTLSEDEPGRLRSGETLGEALAALGLDLLQKVDAILFNCTSPERISQAIPLLLKEPLLPVRTKVGGYANGFVKCCDENCRAVYTGEMRDLDEEEYWNVTRGWIRDVSEEKGCGSGGSADAATDDVSTASESLATAQRGVVVGGCCGVFPSHIQRMRRGIDEQASGSAKSDLSGGLTKGGCAEATCGVRCPQGVRGGA